MEFLSVTGIERIDAGHKKVIDRINNLVGAILSDENVDEILNQCGIVFKAIEDQFVFVETELELCGSKYLNVMKAEHKRFLGQMHKLKKEFMADSNLYKAGPKVGKLRSMYYAHLSKFDAFVFADEGEEPSS